MKKDRNSFFSQYGVSSYNTQPFAFPNQMMYDPNMNNNYYSNTEYDLETKVNKMERELKILEQRISKIESELTSTLANNDYNFANSMYMV